MKIGPAVLLIALLPAWQSTAQERVEKWGIYEISLRGPAADNPFTGIDLSAVFDTEPH